MTPDKSGLLGLGILPLRSDGEDIEGEGTGKLTELLRRLGRQTSQLDQFHDKLGEAGSALMDVSPFRRRALKDLEDRRTKLNRDLAGIRATVRDEIEDRRETAEQILTELEARGERADVLRDIRTDLLVALDIREGFDRLNR